MFPDPITPKSFPDQLQSVTYDPFKVMPVPLPVHPRVLTNAAQLQRARERIADGHPIDVACLRNLLAACHVNRTLPAEIPIPDRQGLLNSFAGQAACNAVAFLLTDDERHRSQSIALLRLVAHACPRTDWNGFEHGRIRQMAIAYDALVAGGLDEGDDALFRDMLYAMPAYLDRNGHRGCNNHNPMNQSGRIAVGAALGCHQTIHDTLYGRDSDAGWRYGIIHGLRHDVLSDGMQWEGSMSYHLQVTARLCESLSVLQNCGIDLWHRELPALMQNDGQDEHRGWGPKGMKCFKSMFDVFFYQTFPNGDYSGLHDMTIGNMRALWAWAPIFPKAFDIYRDPKYAWLLNHMQREYPAKPPEVLPIWFRNRLGDMSFVHIEEREYPDGAFSLTDDANISLAGRHVNGCTLMPVNGSTFLRIRPEEATSPAAMLYWGPHWAGHRSPACLHLEVHAGGRRVTHAPHLSHQSYGDPLHLGWTRTTIAHNTVSVDEASMFPFDFETDSPWECDLWRDTISDSNLAAFQPEDRFNAVRVWNDNVYRDVVLDRTVLLTEEYLVDVYRVIGQEARQYDWAVHLCHPLQRPARAQGVRLGKARGYDQLSAGWRHPQRKDWVSLPFKKGSVPARIKVLLPVDGELLVARDPAPDDRTPAGDRSRPPRRTSAIVRARAVKTVFVSVWSFGARNVPAALVRGGTDADLHLEVGRGSKKSRWVFPLDRGKGISKSAG